MIKNMELLLSGGIFNCIWSFKEKCTISVLLVFIISFVRSMSTTSSTQRIAYNTAQSRRNSLKVCMLTL